MLFTPFEAKTTFRFLMSLSGVPAYLIKSSGFPEVDNSEIDIEFTNTNFYLKGKSKWQPLTITLYDPVSPQASQMIHTWLNQHHNSTNGIDGYAFGGYKKDVTLKALDPAQSAVEVWTLFGCYGRTMNWGEGDWTTDEAKELEVELRYDYAVHG